MLTSKLTDYKKCLEIPELLATIDCKISLEAKKLFQNLTLMLNSPIDDCLIGDLLHYKRILIFKYCNPEYACEYSLEQILGKVKGKTVGADSVHNVTSTYFTTTTTTTTLT